MTTRSGSSLPSPGAASAGMSTSRVGSTTSACQRPPLRKIPIIFVPGVMGSRLEFPTLKQRWDPDHTFRAMFYWVRISAERGRRELRYSTPARVMTTGDDLSDLELKHGYAGVAAKYYLGLLRYLDGHVRPEIEEKLHIESQVYAIGYDWRQSNRISGAYVTREVNRILAAEGAGQCLLISHSMGGIVTRSAMKNGLAGKVIGVIHIFQPVDGAPVMYRRFFTGATMFQDGVAMDLILGNTGEKFSTLVSGMPGPLQLLPTNNYRDMGGAAWLKFARDGHEVAYSGDVYSLYTGAACPPAAMEFEAAARGDRAAVAADLRAHIGAARAFHQDLGRYKHPKTKTIHGTNRTTDMAVLFDPPTEPPPTMHNMGHGEVSMRVDWHNRGAHAQRHSEGDGTVPSTSANPLTPAVANEGTEHSAACDNRDVQEYVRIWVRQLLA